MRTNPKHIYADRGFCNHVTRRPFYTRKTIWQNLHGKRECRSGGKRFCSLVSTSIQHGPPWRSVAKPQAAYDRNCFFASKTLTRCFFNFWLGPFGKNPSTRLQPKSWNLSKILALQSHGILQIFLEGNFVPPTIQTSVKFCYLSL